MRILLVSAHDGGDRMEAALRQLGHAVVSAHGLIAATEALVVQRFDAVVVRGDMPDAEMSEFTAAVRELDRRVGVSAHTALLRTINGNSSRGAHAGYGSDIDGVVSESIDADALTLAISRLASALGSDSGAAKATNLAPELAVLDVEELRAQVAYDSELLVELIDLYLSERSRQSEEMAEALLAGDYDTLSRVAHTIKGSLGSLHADAARATAQNVELAARDRDVAKCNDFLPHFERQLNELEEHLLALRHNLRQS